jgi:hypothetical protein
VRVVARPVDFTAGKTGFSTDAEIAVLQCVDDAEHPLTRTQLETALGGNHARARDVVGGLIQAGVLQVKKLPAPEGKEGHDKVRDRVVRSEKLKLSLSTPPPEGTG